jgi:formate hydrogenlyase subunit 4
MKILMITLQTLILISIAPLMQGVIMKVKNWIRMRKGPSVFQPYYNLNKFLLKDEVIAQQASWIFTITPFIVCASAVTAMCLVPVFFARGCINSIGDFFVVLFVLAIGRFFLALAGLDTGSAFGGMGSSREMFISSFAEPVAFLAVFAIALGCGTTDLITISGMHRVNISSLIAVIALFMVILAETSRVPIDNQETHLELTMIHEAMILEYSGRSLALLEFASYIKQMLFLSILAVVIFPNNFLYPHGCHEAIFSIGIHLGKVLAIALIIAVLEISIAKMRLFRIVDFLSFGFVLAVFSVIAAIIGV